MPSVLDQPTTSPLVRAMCAIIRLVVVLPLVPVTATTGIFGVMVVGRVPARDGGDLLGGGADRRLDVGGRQRVERVRDRLAERTRPLAVAPREGHDEHLRVGGGAHAHGEPARARLARDGADESLDRPQGEALPEAGAGCARARGPQARCGARSAAPPRRWHH